MSFKISTRDLERMLGGLENSADVVSRSNYRAINKVANKTFTRSRRDVVSKVTLTQSYVRERMDMVPATAAKPTAIISARRRPTRLATYGARQLVRRANQKRITKSGGGMRGGRGARGLWGTQAGTGDRLRGIPAGSVQAGASVKVKRSGNRKRMPGAFFLPLRRGAGKLGGNGMGVFIRTGKGKADIKHLYGPSVDQIFRGFIKDKEAEIAQELREAIAKQTEYEVRKAVKRL